MNTKHTSNPDCTLRSPPGRRPRTGFTLIELLVVIAIIGVLIALLLPAIQAAREAARRSSCSNNLAQIMVALANYESTFESLPAGVRNPAGPIRNVPSGSHHSWMIAILPFMEQQNAYRRVDFNKSVYEPANQPVRKLSISMFICPSNPMDSRIDGSAGSGKPAGPSSDPGVRGISSYAGYHNDVEAPIAADNRGVMFLNSHVRNEDIADGTSNTIYVGEKLHDENDLGWMSGTRATLRNTGSPMSNPSGRNPWTGAEEEKPVTNGDKVPADKALAVGGFGSAHSGGVVMFGFGDGRVTPLVPDIDPKVYRLLGHRADGELIDTPGIFE